MSSSEELRIRFLDAILEERGARSDIEQLPKLFQEYVEKNRRASRVPRCPKAVYDWRRRVIRNWTKWGLLIGVIAGAATGAQLGLLSLFASIGALGLVGLVVGAMSGHLQMCDAIRRSSDDENHSSSNP